MAISGTFYGSTGNAWIKPRIQWSAKTNPEGNYSDVTATLAYTRTNSGYTTYGHWKGSLTINGSTKSVSSLYMEITEKGYTTAITHSVRVYHDQNGQKTITISASGSIPDTSLTSTSIRASVKLEEIPRAASITAADTAIGSVCPVTIGRKNDAHSCTVAYSFGSLSGYLTGDGIGEEAVYLQQSTLAFPLPEDFYLQIPNAPTGTCTLTCTTWQADQIIGTPQQTTFTVQADPDLCAPVLRVRLADVEPVTVALTGDDQTLVRYGSKLQCVLEADARCGASLTEKKVADAVLEGDTLIIEGAQTGQVRFSARDSRGYVTQWESDLTLIPYSYPTGRMQAARTDDTSGLVDIQLQGNWYGGSFGQRENTLQIRCTTADGQWKQLQAQTNGDTFSVTARLSGFDYSRSHKITMEITDRIHTVTYSAHINPGIPAFDWGKEDFCFHIPVTAEKVTGLAAPEASADAVNKAYVDKSCQELRTYADSKSGMKLLWENASPSSAFPAQTLTLPLSEYSLIWVDYSMAINNDPAYSIGVVACPVGKNLVLYMRGYAGRKIYTSNTKIEFGISTAGAEELIPLRVYGIRGVSG